MSTMLAEARQGFHEGIKIYIDTWRQIFRLISRALKFSKGDIKKIRDKR